MTCSECGKIGHMKNDCPNLVKKKIRPPSKQNSGGKGRKAYIAWEDDDKDSPSSSLYDNEISNLRLMTHSDDEDKVCLWKIDMKWFLDNGCPRHMIGGKSKFIELHAKKRGYVIYREKNRCKILGKGVVGNPSTILIENVLLVERLKRYYETRDI